MKTHKMVLGFFFLTLGLMSCEKEKTSGIQQAANDLTVHVIGQNNLYGSSSEGFTQENHVINNSVAWNALKAQMNQNNDVTYTFTEQEIDFSQWTVLASFDQVRPNGGYAINYSSVFEDDAQITVTIDQSSPNGAATTVITQPFIVVKIQKTTKPVVFN